MDVYWKKGRNVSTKTNIKVKIFAQVNGDIIYFIFIFDGRPNRIGYLRGRIEL